MEIWRKVFGLEDYLVSNLGRVKSLKYGREKILKLLISTTGYPIIYIWEKPYNRKKKVHKVHRLVLSSFTDSSEHKEEVNHKNGIKTDNRLENLEWCTRSENMLHAYKIGLRVPNVGPALRARGIKTK